MPRNETDDKSGSFRLASPPASCPPCSSHTLAASQLYILNPPIPDRRSGRPVNSKFGNVQASSSDGLHRLSDGKSCAALASLALTHSRSTRRTLFYIMREKRGSNGVEART